MRNRKKKSNYREFFARSAVRTAGILVAYVIGLLFIALIIHRGVLTENAGVRAIPFWGAFCVLSGCLVSMRSGKAIVLSAIPVGLFLLLLFLIGFFCGEPDWVGEGRYIPLFCIAASGAAGAFSLRRNAKNFKRRTMRL